MFVSVSQGPKAKPGTLRVVAIRCGVAFILYSPAEGKSPDRKGSYRRSAVGARMMVTTSALASPALFVPVMTMTFVPTGNPTGEELQLVVAAKLPESPAVTLVHVIKPTTETSAVPKSVADDEQ